MDPVVLAALEDELEKIAFYGEIFPKIRATPRAAGVNVRKVLEAIRTRVAPRAPQTAKQMEQAVEQAVKVHPKKGRHVSFLFDPLADTEALPTRQLRRASRFEGQPVNSPSFKRWLGEQGAAGRPGAIHANRSEPAVLAHEMGHIQQPWKYQTDRYVAQHPLSDEIDATRRALKSMGKKYDTDLSFGLASHHALSNPDAKALLLATKHLSPLTTGAITGPSAAKLERVAKKVTELVAREEPSKLTGNFVKFMDRNYRTSENLRLLPAMPKKFKDLVRARRRISERAVGRAFGPAAEKDLRRAMNRELTQRYLHGQGKTLPP